MILVSDLIEVRLPDVPAPFCAWVHLERAFIHGFVAGVDRGKRIVASLIVEQVVGLAPEKPEWERQAFLQGESAGYVAYLDARSAAGKPLPPAPPAPPDAKQSPSSGALAAVS